MKETDIEISERTKNPFEKRTATQRKADRDFITQCIIHEPEATKTAIHAALMEHIKERGDEYVLEYTYVCTEVNKIRKELQGVGIIDETFIESERMRSLDLINENIAICCQEIQVRMTQRENVSTSIEDLTVKDMKGLSIEEIHVLNRLQDKVKKRTVTIRKIRAGQDVRDMMEILLKWIQKKGDLLGEDAPKKVSQKIDARIIDERSMTIEHFENEIKSLGYNPELITMALEQTLNNKNGKRASNEG